MVQQPPHFLLVSLPSQGHINPALRFAQRLVRTGARVTFITADRALRRMSKVPSFDGLSISCYSDGIKDEDDDKKVDPMVYMSEIKRHSTEFLTDFIVSKEREGNPIDCLIYTVFIPWVPELARELRVPAVLLCIQPAAVLNLYYYYFREFGDKIKNATSDSSSTIDLPGLPPLKSIDLPSIMIPSNPFAFALQVFEEEIEMLDKAADRSRILVNTFDELEADALGAVEKFNMVAVGPLIPSEFLDSEKHDPQESFGGDLFEGDLNDYREWLDSKIESSVVYVSFGSLAELPKKQMEELARGLLDSGYAFLWVIREKVQKKAEAENVDDKLSFMAELKQQGMIVKWCSQLDVLSHPSLGCFVTHCGWNSTMEGLVCGVPMVAFPQFSDQPTNAKLIEDQWKVGVRVKVNEEGIVGREEIKRCLDEIMGSESEKSEDLRMKAMKWKSKAREAGKEGGLSDMNLRAFVEDVASGRLVLV